MKRTLTGLAKLTRFNEYVYFVAITTLLGVAAAGGEFNGQLLILLGANWTAVGFAFMINDVEDAPDDALSTGKLKRNPVSSGLISPKAARIATFIVALISAGLFSFLGFWPFILGVFSLLLGFLYSVKAVRLKTIAFFDVLSHSLMLAGLQYLCGYFTYASRFNQVWFWPFTFVMSISIYGELYNELRDLEGDRLARLRHTAIVLGERAATVFMNAMLILGLCAGVVTFFIINIIPAWVRLAIPVFVLVFILPTLIKIRRGDDSMAIQASLQKPLERAVAMALILQFLLPWLDQLWQLGLFGG